MQTTLSFVILQSELASVLSFLQVDLSFHPIQEKACSLEQKLQRKEQECELYLRQASQASQGQEHLSVPNPQALEHQKLELQDSIMAIQNIVKSQDLGNAEVSGELGSCASTTKKGCCVASCMSILSISYSSHLH